MVRYYSRSQLESIIGCNEQVLWRGKPNIICFVLESIFNPLLPFAVLWLLFDSFFIFNFTSTKGSEQMMGFLIPFFLLHLMPVWIYIVGVLLTFLKYKNTEYLITDKRIYTSGGSVVYTEGSVSYSKITDVQIRRGFFDRKLGVGDVLIFSNSRPEWAPVTTVNGKVQRFSGYDITDIPDYRAVYNLIFNNIELQERLEEKTTENEDTDASSFLDLYRKKKRRF